MGCTPDRNRRKGVRKGRMVLHPGLVLRPGISEPRDDLLDIREFSIYPRLCSLSSCRKSFELLMYTTIFESTPRLQGQ